METILNYLENMFSSLPQTEEVLRAKRELAAMMEDKYNELLEEGRTDNEAVGIVISEFGNLKELSAELGIDEIYYGESVGLQGRFVHDTEVKKYMEQTKKSSIWIGLATMLCIFSPILLLILGGLQDNGHNVTDVMLVCFGLGALFLMIAAAVGLFIFHGTMLDKYDYLKKENIRISSESVSYLRTYQEKTENSYLIRLIVGVIMCIISVIPLLVVGVTYEDNELYGSLAVSALLLIVGIAVFMFITAGMERDAVKILLQEGDYTLEKKENSRSDDKIGGIYWPIITCIYLVWSFFTGNWGYTWIIWPIAGVLYAAIVAICREVRKKS